MTPTTNITKGNNISLSGNNICHNYIYGNNISQIQKAITSVLWAITSATIIYMAITSAKYNIFSYQNMWSNIFHIILDSNISLMGNNICHNHIYGNNISQIQKAITSVLWAITSATIIYMAITSAKYNIFSYQNMWSNIFHIKLDSNISQQN